MTNAILIVLKYILVIREKRKEILGRIFKMG